ncbi:A24 family peptidase [Azospira restricta]|uniref:Prepilin peptidase n=1 Tax=Azospira restricta TaxID=404405 RepID=A0A974PWU6_9RHOO|nr:prepilin peptidase [Azospira restricta]QRJ62924.1 prepilin peptidase [Azospira restricta]
MATVFFHLVLVALLLAAALTDFRHHRVSNRLVLGGLLAAFAFHLVVPTTVGVWSGVLGMLLGFALLLPFYLLRGMAAGDVKLMAMVGAFVGPALTFWAVVATFLIGGVWAIVVVARRNAWARLAANLRHLPSHAGDMRMPVGGTASLGRIPYAVAIACGTIAVLAVELVSR